MGSDEAADDADLDDPTTQVKMSGAQPGYDPLAAVSIMEQMRNASSEGRQPNRLPLIGHLPIVRQFQMLGGLLVAFIVLALLMLYLNTRLTTQVTASANIATEMQMLSQRLARGTSLAVQGNVPAFESVLEIRSGHRDIAHPTQRVFCTESNQSLWIVQPAGIQKNRIHYAEDGYIRANTKSERKNRSYRECRRLAQLAQSITKFLNNSAHSQSFIRPVFAEQLCPSEHV